MAEHFNVVEQFGIDVFNEETMKQRLPKNVFKALKKTIAEGKELDSSIADVVASAMKDWAIEKGATHYTHWFQPMTGPMRPASRPAVSEQRSRREAIPHGILPPMHS